MSKFPFQMADVAKIKTIILKIDISIILKTNLIDDSDSFFIIWPLSPD